MAYYPCILCGIYTMWPHFCTAWGTIFSSLKFEQACFTSKTVSSSNLVTEVHLFSQGTWAGRLQAEAFPVNQFSVSSWPRSHCCGCLYLPVKRCSCNWDCCGCPLEGACHVPGSAGCPVKPHRYCFENASPESQQLYFRIQMTLPSWLYQNKVYSCKVYLCIRPTFFSQNPGRKGQSRQSSEVLRESSMYISRSWDVHEGS